MDTQRKKGVIEICVLASLQKEPSYGYRIVQNVSQCVEISESTLYPILRRLESNNCVSTFSQEHSGRLRKYYKLEQPGKEKIEQFLSEADEMRKIYSFIEEESK